MSTHREHISISEFHSPRVEPALLEEEVDIRTRAGKSPISLEHMCCPESKEMLLKYQGESKDTEAHGRAQYGRTGAVSAKTSNSVIELC